MKSKLLLMTAIVLSTSSVFAAKTPVTPKVIYGLDDRADVYESSDYFMRLVSRSTAAMIRNENIASVGGEFFIKAPTLEEVGICKNERFSQQPSAAECSGFLVAPDKLVTAGHCVKDVAECNAHVWIFDYANTTREKSEFKIIQDQAYRCVEIIERQQDQNTKADYAVLRLNRAVVGRTPLEYRKSGKPTDTAVFTVIGHPSGLPTKITSSAQMRNNQNQVFFVTNADTYGGNSGSAVVDSKTGIVEGVLVRGDTDYEDSSVGCKTSVYRPQDAGRGEDVTRINIIGDLLK